jgi:hypothetical protein
VLPYILMALFSPPFPFHRKLKAQARHEPERRRYRNLILSAAINCHGAKGAPPRMAGARRRAYCRYAPERLQSCTVGQWRLLPAGVPDWMDRSLGQT